MDAFLKDEIAGKSRQSDRGHDTDLASLVLRRSWALVGQKIDDREKSSEDIDIDGKSQTAWKYG